MQFLSEKPRILFFIGSLRSGGKERRLVELLSYLKSENKYEILLVMTKNEIHYEQFHQLKIEYRIIRKTFKKNDPTLSYKFYKLCGEFKPDIIHAWGRMQAFYTIPAVLFKNIPLVNSQITGAPAIRKYPVSDRIIDFINFRFSRIVLSNSKAGQEAFRPPQAKQKVIYNGINQNRFDNLPAVDDIRGKYGILTPYAVIMVASFTPTKDYNLFLQVAQQVTATRNDITFIGVGGYDKNDDLFLKMKSLSSTNPQIIFHSQIRDVEALVNACTIGVLFSTNGEGISNSILEYMALGKPVVANNSGGTAELIVDGENGYLITEDSAEEIGQLITELVDNIVKLRSIGIANKNRISNNFSIDVMGSAFEKVYCTILAAENANERFEQTIITSKI